MPGNAYRSREDVLRRREEVKALAAEGTTASAMAEILGVTERTIYRDLAALGLTHRNHWIWTPEMDQLARNLLEDQCPYTEVARTIGCNQWTVMRRFPGYGRVGNPLGNGRHMRLADELGLGLCNYNPRGQITA